MMQPLSLTTSLYPRGLTAGVSGGLLASPQASVTRSTLGAPGGGGGQLDMSTMLPMMMQVLSLIVQLMQTMSGGGLAKGTAGNGGGAGGAGGAGNAGGAGGAYGTGAGGAGNVGGIAGGILNADGTGGGAGGAGNAAGGVLPGGAPPSPFVGGNATGQSLDQLRAIDYTQLNADQRQQLNGVSRESAAILHLGGRAHVSDDATPNGVSSSARIYNNVLNNPNSFSPQEVALVRQWAQDEQSRYGFFTGENLDHAFIEEMGARNGTDVGRLQQYHAAVDQRVAALVNSPNRQQIIAESQQQLNISSDLDVLQQQSGLTHAEQAVYRLAGHSVLFSGNGAVDGSILPLTLGNANSLDGRSFGTQNTNIDKQTQDIMDADLADDGQVNGSALRAANNLVMDKIFLGSGGIQDSSQIRNQGIQAGMSTGRTMQDIQRSIFEGGQQALQDFKNLATNHTPGMLAGAATMAGAAAICPFLGGMAAGAMGIGAGQKALQQ